MSVESARNSASEYMQTLNDVSELENSSINSVNETMEITTKDNVPLHIKDDEIGVSTEKGEFIFRKMYVVAVAVLLNAVCVGYAATYTSTATEDMKRANSVVHPNDQEVGWIGSILAIGALFGGIVAGQLAESIGRKGALLASTIPFVLGWYMIAFATSLPYIYVGRIIVGLCCGVITVTAPMYLVEISTPDVRGLLGASFQLFVTIGVLLISCLGAAMSWSWSALGGSILSVITLAAMVFIPESPRWLMSKGRKEEALWTIHVLHGTFLNAEEESKTMQTDIDNQPKGSFKLAELKSPEVYKPAFLSFALMIFQQCSGVNAVLFYTVAIFKNSGSTLAPTSATIIVATVQVISTLVSSVLMDKAGRKVLLLVSGSIMAVSHLVFGGFDLAVSKDTTSTLQTTYGWLPILCIVVFISAFSLGYGPIPWLMVGEMTSVRFRSATSGIATMINWLFVFIITKLFHGMEDTLHTYGTYWTFGVVCGVSCVFTFFMLPETKGKQVEEIQEYFAPKKNDITPMKEV